MREEPMIAVRGLSKVYSGRRVLGPVDLDIPKGVLCGLVGPNGSGKSTLLRIIAGFEQADTGSITLNGFDAGPFIHRRKLIGYLPESMELYPVLLVREFISWWPRMVGANSERLVEALHLQPVLHKPIKSLSKGYRQRLKLFAALSLPRTVLILDEPLDGFDLLQLREIIALMRQKRDEGTTVLVSIHQLGDAEKACDYFVLLNEGKALCCGALDELALQFNCSRTLETIYERALS